MSYPVVTLSNAQRLVDELKQGGGDPKTWLISLTDESGWISERPGSGYNRLDIEAASAQMLADHYPDPALALDEKSSTALESAMAGPLHSTLSQCPVELLADEDFWRYLALFPFRWYLLAREPELQAQDFGGFNVVVNPHSGKEMRRKPGFRAQLLFRTYLWGRCALDGDDGGGTPGEHYRRAKVTLPVAGLSTIDFWHSHMVRVQLGHLGRVPLAFIDEAVRRPLTTDGARELEKLLTRMKHTVLFDVYDDQQAASLMRELAPKAVERVK